jgi:phospholipid/cholesterol/gamma-HCH transport system substrate-binding protein
VNHRVAINLGFFAFVFAVTLWWTVNNVVTVEALERPYTIQGDFEQAAGVLPRAEVAYLGVNHGTVDRVDRIPGGVRVTMKIHRDKRIPAGATAHVWRKSAIGEPYIDFAPPPGGSPGDGPYLEAGDIVPMERTAVPLEFSELLRSASAVISGIDPDRAGVLIHELAVALHGRGDSLRQLTRAGDELTGTFAERTDLLDRLAVNNTRLTATVTRHRESLGGSISDLRAVADSLRSARDDTSILLDRGSRLLTEAAALVDAAGADLDCILGDVEHTVIPETTNPERLDGLRTLLVVGPRAFHQVFDTRDEEDDGVWVRVGIVINPDNPPAQYVPPRELAEARAPAPCGSTLSASGLQPSGVDFVPASSRGAVPPGAPTGGAAALVLAGLAGAVVLRLSPRVRPR